MTIPMMLVEAVAAAVEKLSRPGVDGWGLEVSRSMREAGDVLDLGEHVGCTSETCSHISHDPAAPMRRWVPKSGRVIDLGSDEEPGETIVRWYAHLDGEEVRYIRLREPRFGWATAEYVKSVPDWALASLGKSFWMEGMSKLMR